MKFYLRIRTLLVLAMVLLLAVAASCRGGPDPDTVLADTPYGDDRRNLLTTQRFFDLQDGNSSTPDFSRKRYTASGLVLSGRDRQVLEVYLGDTVRLRWTEAGSRQPISYALIEQPSYVKTAVNGSGSRFSATVNEDSGVLAITEHLADGTALVRLTVNPGQSRYSADGRMLAVNFPSASAYYGMGEKAGSLNHQGKRLRMWNTDAYGYRDGTDPLYVSIPFFYVPVSGTDRSHTLGVLLDNPGNSFFDFDSTGTGTVYLGVQTGEVDLYLLSAGSPASVLSEYSTLTGRYPLPPEWSLGYQQCRYSYFPQDRVLEVAHEFRNRKLPIDVIYLDIDFMNGYRCFTWDQTRFPDPAAMIAGLSGMNIRTITIIDPGIKLERGYSVFDQGFRSGYFVKRPDGTLARGTVWPGISVFPDYFLPKVRNWWGPLYKPLKDLGIAGFWNDMNEPAVFNSPIKTLHLDAVHREADGRTRSHLEVHNAYGQVMAQASYEGLQRLAGDSRVFLLSRAGYAGIQRWAAKWTGDNTANWDHLALSVPMILNLSISGVPLVGADIGGYARSPEGELFVRWMQLGALHPLYRGHTEKGTPDQEPWSFGPRVEELSRQALALRYRMLPFWLQLMREHWDTGKAPVQPLWFAFPDDAAVRAFDNTLFMIGSEILAAPVLSRGAEFVAVQFPAGKNWIDIQNGRRYKGGTFHRYPVDIHSVPLFARDDAIIPWGPDQEYWQRRELHLRLPVLAGEDFTGRTAQLELLWDDGETLAYRNGFSRWQILLHDGELTVTHLDGALPVNIPVHITDITGTPLVTIDEGFKADGSVWRKSL